VKDVNLLTVKTTQDEDMTFLFSQIGDSVIYCVDKFCSSEFLFALSS
jgi:hypothetical protein